MASKEDCRKFWLCKEEEKDLETPALLSRVQEPKPMMETWCLFCIISTTADFSDIN